MSLLSKIAKGIGGIVKKVAPIASFIPGPVGAVGKLLTIGAGVGAAAGVGRLATIQAGAMGGLPALIRTLPAVLPGAGRVAAAAGGAVMAAGRSGGLMRIGRAAARAAGYIVTGSYIYDAAHNLVGRAPGRRMNPMNYKAAVRAARRVKRAQKMLRKIDKLCGGTHRRAAPFAKRK